MSNLPKVNLDEPRWDQNTYVGRVKYFFTTTNPLNILATPKQLEEAKRIVKAYKAGEKLPKDMTMKEVYKAKDLYDSAFHPDTGEKMILIGRMSAQVPMNMVITGCMMTFYKSNLAVVFWQWFNQSFNAIVNFTNRSGDSKLTTAQIFTSYLGATGGAVCTALYLNRLASQAPSILGRFVPFTAVAAANSINIPLMRINELRNGVQVFDENGNKLGHSKKAAQTGIISVLVSRIVMASPSMIFTPIIMNYLEHKDILLKKYPRSAAPLQTLICGFFLTFATPMACALFSQKSKKKVSSLEIELQKRIQEINPSIEFVYFNKGL
uniref:Sidoreflexin n=1 Tax=Clastoptera arizonana TaxID=38151 RepID=A0A1B6EGL8_9HEMI